MAGAALTAQARAGRRALLRRGALGSLALALAPGFSMRHARAEPESAPGARMAGGAPSATAMSAALMRAVHQVVDHPRVLDDPWAVPILGAEGAQGLQAGADRQSRTLRALIAMRSRYAEDRLAAAVRAGVRQYVVLGAGLDTFAWRNPHAALGLRVFEVDHPATQAWKRARLEAAGIAAASSMSFTPVDFETQSLAGQLARSGFDPRRPAFFSLLGVVIYLTEAAVMETMRVVTACAPGSQITFDFPLPAALLDEAARARRARSIERMAALGEPWVTFFAPEALAAKLGAAGFRDTELLTPQAANRTYFHERVDGLRIAGSAHMMSATV